MGRKKAWAPLHRSRGIRSLGIRLGEEIYEKKPIKSKLKFCQNIAKILLVFSLSKRKKKKDMYIAIRV